ncbi:L-2-hydroxyglutarate oxidase LhgO [Neomicrococcus lactis]|uniref:L-2-hydroxyglutarate oxidase LhgO n=2 Tax=Neomicrococcus lactis TaxID=732241 RepID=A0A7W8YD37_9MICC|nr:L-2-hydroxyglutarate oxidase LhgO [Neomicrococcus lactis]
MKYYSPATDLSALERELGGARTSSTRSASPVVHDDYDETDYSSYEDKYADYDDEDDTRRIG